MTEDIQIRLMNGNYCQRNEIPDYSGKEVFIPVLQKSKIIEQSEDDSCTITVLLVGIFDCYIMYINDIYVNEQLEEFNHRYLTLYNYRDFTISNCSGNSILWKRGIRSVVVDIDANEIRSLSGDEHFSFNFNIPINDIYPFAHWEFSGIIDCIANDEDLALQVKDSWECPESHTLIIHSIIPVVDCNHVGTFEVTYDEDHKLYGKLLCIKNAKVYIERQCNDETTLCVFDLYGNELNAKDLLKDVAYEKLNAYVNYNNIIKDGDREVSKYLKLKERKEVLNTWLTDEIIESGDYVIGEEEDEEKTGYYEDLVMYSKEGDMIKNHINFIEDKIKYLEKNSKTVNSYNDEKKYRSHFINLRLYQSIYAPFQYTAYGNTSKSEMSVIRALDDDEKLNICWFCFLCGEIYKDYKGIINKVKNFDWNTMIKDLDYIIGELKYFGKNLDIPSINLEADNSNNILTPYIYSFYAGRVDEDYRVLKEKEIEQIKFQSKIENLYRQGGYRIRGHSEDESMVMAALENGNDEYYGL